jgi:hypothetical protein
MRKILWSLIGISLVVGTPLLASADAAYDKFKKTQMKEFQGDKAPDNCKLKKREVIESGNKTLYELCAVKGKPIFLRVSNGGVTYGFYAFKKGKIVQSTAVDAFISIGLRNEKPVVQWNFGDQTVNYKLSDDLKQSIQEDVTKIKQILKKF